jgi:putative ABC transport system substrate-binding protein
MKRRQFITLLGGAAVALPFTARAQQPLPVIGFLTTGTAEANALQFAAFLKGLSETGYVDGRNVVIDKRWAENSIAQLPQFAADLVRRSVTLIAAGGSSATVAAKAATTTIPIVFAMGVDPVERGFVASLARPGGNLTGVSNLNVGLEPKRLEMLHELVPAATDFALLTNLTNPLAESLTQEVEAAARSLGLTLHVLHASTERELDAVFDTLARLGIGGLVIGNEGLFIDARERIGAMTLRRAVPAIFQFREFAAAGGLMSYGSNIPETWRQFGVYAGRVLKGEKPADLPVIQSTRVELFINLKTAKALGLSVPLGLLARADEVIE